MGKTSMRGHPGLDELNLPGIKVYNRPCVFCVVSGPNQSYYPEFDWKCLSPYSTQKVKGITS